MKIRHTKIHAAIDPIFAAGEEENDTFDDFDDVQDYMDDGGINDTLDDISDDIEDIQDDVDDITEDDVNIDIENNISGHYIAECDTCHGVFISAMVESDQAVESIRGVCPLCDKDTEQFLKWVITPVDERPTV